MTATVSLENLADLVETELSSLGKKIIDRARKNSETTEKVFRELYKEVSTSVELAVQSIRDNDQEAALAVVNRKETITQLLDDLLTREAADLGRDQGAELESARLEISLIEKMSRVYNLSRRIATITIPPEIDKGE